MPEMCHADIKRSKMIKKIQELEFAAVELNLYLDNNPNNLQALNDYNMTSERLMALKEDFEMEFGPLTNFGCGKSKCPWQWVEEPWPWELGE